MNQLSKKNDLEERTAKFGEEVVGFCRSLKKDVIITQLISQLVRSATSVGANYMEAQCASSRKDFRNKIFICKKEAQESQHWLRMIAKYIPDRKSEIMVLWKETHELTLILQKITMTLDANSVKAGKC